MDAQGIPLTDALLRSMLYSCGRTADEYQAGLERVLRGELNPRDAVLFVEHGGRLPDPENPFA